MCFPDSAWLRRFHGARQALIPGLALGPPASSRYGLQAAGSIDTLQGATNVLSLSAGGAVILRAREDWQHLFAFVLMFSQSLLFDFGGTTTAL